MISTTVQVRASRATTERTTIVVINVHTAIWATIRNLGTMSNTWSVGKTVQRDESRPISLRFSSYSALSISPRARR